MEAVEVFEMAEKGFHPVVVFEKWRVAIFNDAPEWREESIMYLQKHDYSDEVFVLLRGACTLILSDEERPEKMYGVRMESGKVYNVRKGKWHSHVLEEGTSVLVVENSDTAPENSSKTRLPYPFKLSDLEYVGERTK